MSKKKGLGIMNGLAAMMSKKSAKKPSDQDDSAIDGIPESEEKESEGGDEGMLPKKKMSGKQLAAIKQKSK